MDQDVIKKLKGLDGLAVPVGCDHPKGDDRHLVLEASKSLEQNVDGLTGGTDGSTEADHHTQGNNGSESMPSAENDVKVHIQDERQLKQERRKQANRESARRSRLRKQAEYEELVRTCESLNTENMALKSELDVLKGDSKELRLANAALRETLKNAQVVQQGGIASIKIEVDLTLPNGTENILGNLGSVSRNAQLDREAHESSMSETKLYQLSRTDAVAAR